MSDWKGKTYWVTQKNSWSFQCTYIYKTKKDQKKLMTSQAIDENLNIF